MRDLDVRVALHQVLEAHRHDPGTMVIDELGLCHGQARVDVAVINGQLVAYEIKSDSDTLARLEAQSAIYSLVFDQVYLVSAREHLAKAGKMVPRWWGLLSVSERNGKPVIASRRKPGPNPSPDLHAQAQLLWRDEAMAILESRGLAKGVRSLPKAGLYQRLVEGVPADDLRREIRESIKRRADWRTRGAARRPA